MTEPDRLLTECRPHLTASGGILLDSIPYLIDLMKSTNGKLVPKCITLCIISSSAPEVQSRLCKEGVWDILLKWLQEALKEDNYAFLLELLNVYLRLPVRLEQLTQNVCPKLINSLTKRCDHEEVRVLAAQIVKKWKDVISSDSRRTELSESKRKRVDPEIKPENNQISEDHKIERKRPRTVKVPPTVMRTAGVEDPAQTQPKSRSDVLSKKRFVDFSNIFSSKSDDSKSTVELPIESFHQKITVNPSEPKKSTTCSYSPSAVVAEIHESPDFINALTTPNSSVVRKKRKVIPAKIDLVAPSEPPQTISINHTSPVSTEASPLSTTPPVSSAGMGARKSSLTSLSAAFSSDSKPKKRVSWADEDKLQSIHYFELDESERVNVNRISLDEGRKKDMSMERHLFRRTPDEFLISSEKWHTPLPLERIFLVEPGCKSVERMVQTERVRYVLQAIYFTRESIPQSPEEPDVETVESSTPLDIPLEDLTLSNSSDSPNGQISEKLLVVSDAQGNSQVSLNPEVADLVKSLAANLTCTPSTPEVSNAPVDQACKVEPLVTATTTVNSVSSVPATLEDVPNQSVQRELWEVLEQNYPDVNVHDLSAERIRELLEPLKDQLVARGIFQLPPPDVLPPALAPFQHSPPRIPPAFPPQVNYRNMRPVPPMPRPMPPQANFLPGPPAGFRPPHLARPPRFPPSGPVPLFARGPGPMRGPLPPGPMPRRAAPYSRGAGRGTRGQQPCKFFQQGACRNGPACGFLHTPR